MERTLFTINPSSFKERTFSSLYLDWSQMLKLRYRSFSLIVVLLYVVVCLMPVRPTTMEFFSTSRSLLLIVTIFSLDEDLVDVRLLFGSLVASWSSPFVSETIRSHRRSTLSSILFVVFNAFSSAVCFEFDKLLNLLTT